MIEVEGKEVRGTAEEGLDRSGGRMGLAFRDIQN